MERLHRKSAGIVGVLLFIRSRKGYMSENIVQTAVLGFVGSSRRKNKRVQKFDISKTQSVIRFVLQKTRKGVKREQAWGAVLFHV